MLADTTGASVHHARNSRGAGAFPQQEGGGPSCPSNSGPNAMTDAATLVKASSIDIGPVAEETARAYIQAIVERDIVGSMLGAAYRDAEAERLWAVFADRFDTLTTGAYAKPHREAVRLALASI